MEEVHVDKLTVFVAAIVYVIVGAIWYSPYLFGNLFMKLAGVKKKEKSNMLPKIFAEFVVALVIAYFISLLLGFLGATSTMDGIYAAIGVWLGFVVTTHSCAVIWGKMPWQLYLLHMGFFFVGFSVIGGIVGA